MYSKNWSLLGDIVSTKITNQTASLPFNHYAMYERASSLLFRSGRQRNDKQIYSKAAGARFLLISRVKRHFEYTAAFYIYIYIIDSGNREGSTSSRRDSKSSFSPVPFKPDKSMGVETWPASGVLYIWSDSFGRYKTPRTRLRAPIGPWAGDAQETKYTFWVIIPQHFFFKMWVVFDLAIYIIWLTVHVSNYRWEKSGVHGHNQNQDGDTWKCASSSYLQNFIPFPMKGK